MGQDLSVHMTLSMERVIIRLISKFQTLAVNSETCWLDMQTHKNPKEQVKLNSDVIF